MEKVIYRASSLGGCERALVAGRLGYTPLQPPAKFQAIFDAGTDLEQTVVDLVHNEGYDISAQQLETNLVISNSIVVQGHIDGISTREGRSRLLEIKTMNADSWELFVREGFHMGGLMERYKWQVSAYMNSIDDPFNPNTTIELMLVAYNKATEQIHWEIKETPFYTEAEIRERVLSVEAMAARSELPVCDVQQYPCPFYYLHDEPIREEGDEQLDEFVAAYLEARLREQVVKREIAALRESIERSLGDANRVSVTSGNVTRYEQRRTSLDKRAMADDGIDLGKYEHSTTVTSIRVTARKPDEKVDDEAGQTETPRGDSDEPAERE